MNLAGDTLESITEHNLKLTAVEHLPKNKTKPKNWVHIPLFLLGSNEMKLKKCKKRKKYILYYQ